MQLLPLSSKVFQFFFCFYQFLKPGHVWRVPGTVFFFEAFFLDPQQRIGKSPLLFSFVFQMNGCLLYTSHCDRCVKNFYILCRTFNRYILFHIGTKSYQNTHRDRQRIKHLSHCRNHCHPGEVFDIWYQKIFHTFQCSWPRYRINDNDHRQEYQYRHH